MYSVSEKRNLLSYLRKQIDKKRATLYASIKLLTNEQFDGIVSDIKECLRLEAEIDS